MKRECFASRQQRDASEHRSALSTVLSVHDIDKTTNLNTSLGHNRLISTVDTVIEHQHYTVYDNFSLIIRSETADEGGGTSVRTLPESFSTVQMRGELHTSTPIKDFNMDALT